MPELPRERAARFQAEFGLGAYDARGVTASKATAAYFEAAARASGQPKLVANWISGEISRRVNAAGSDAANPVPAEALGTLVRRVADQTISNAAARQLLDAMWSGDGHDVDLLIETKGLRQMQDTGEIERLCDEVLSLNAKSVAEFRAGKDKAFNALVGQAMKASRGKANPELVAAVLRKKLG